MLETGLFEVDLRKIIATAPKKYKTYVIPKRNGGVRPISQPAFEVKVLQRALLRILEHRLPVHPRATAYRHGKSIKDNVIIHAKNGPILKFDFKNFFPSLKASDWISYCKDYKIFSNLEDIEISTNIFFFKGKDSQFLKLAIGAPSSPYLSNVLLRNFDAVVTERMSHDQVTYSRYADDMTISALKTGYLQHVERDLKRIIRQTTTPKLTINDSKTIFANKKYRRSITGLILTNDGRVSIGHDQKKLIRSSVYRALKGELNSAEIQRLSGYLSYISDVEPDFLVRLGLRYGMETIDQLRRQKKTPGA